MPNMYETPPTSRAAPGASTSPSIVQDASKTFIRRPGTKRRSLDLMEQYKRQHTTYASQSSDLLLQEVMTTFEEIPSKCAQYPQMRKDIKAFLESASDKGLRVLFELSRRIKCLEEKVSEVASATTVVANPVQETAPLPQEDKILARLEEMEDSIREIIDLSFYKLKYRIGDAEEKMEEQSVEIINKIHEKIESTQVDIDVAMEGIVVRAQSQLEDLVGTVARDLVVETKSHIGEAIGEAIKLQKPESLPAPVPPMTYARAAAAGPGRRPALHSVAVTSTDSLETAEGVLARVKKAVDARGTGLKISKARKAKNRTVILGCDTEGERDRVRERIESSGSGLVVAPMKNKDPLVVLKDVFVDGDDEDVIRALYTQNAEVFMGLPQEDKELRIKYKKRTRNPETSHIILQVKPKVWQRMTGAGTLYLDLQRVRVEDQSPVVQCTKCLAFGHGRKFCTESVDRCSHCGGPHLREKCPEHSAGIGPRCCNCAHSGLKNVGHNAFSAECQTRQKWDYLARSNTSYL